MKQQIRHGDVFLRGVDGIPSRAQRSRLSEPSVLAYGEVTGHKHEVLDTPVERYEHNGRAYMLLAQAGILTHEEHGQIQLSPGAYEIIIERDYDPTEYSRKVVD